MSQRIDALIKEMTLKEKIGQMMQIHPTIYKEILNQTGDRATVTGPTEPVEVTHEELYNIGSLLTIPNASEAIRLQKEFMKHHRLSIPLLFMYDVIHGYKTIYPIPLALGASWDPSLVEDLSRMAAKEAASSGQHVTFAPMCDLVRDPRWGRVMESPGEDPYLNEIMSTATVKGFQSDDYKTPYSMATCVKHFAAYGAAEAGRDYNTVDLSERWLRQYYLTAYHAAIRAGSPMVMTSFNIYDGIPATLNDFLMKDILRDEWNFDGVLISDWNATAEAMVIGGAEDEADCAAKALNATLDIEMCSYIYNKQLPSLAMSPSKTLTSIDNAVRRILQLKEDLGLFEDPYRDASLEHEQSNQLTCEHRDLSRKGAEASCVLLKNDGTLPFTKTIKNVVILGPLSDSNEILGWWRAQGQESDAVSLKAGIKNLLGDEVNVTAFDGCDYSSNDTSQIHQAVLLAKDADIVILALGEQQDMSGEAGSRGFIDIPGVQKHLAKAVLDLNKPTAMVSFSGRPLLLEWYHHNIPAILHAWFPGSEGGNAIARLLFGDVNPSGKLTMTFPLTMGQIPIYYNAYNVGRPIPSENYTYGQSFTPEDRYHSNYIDIPNAPLYPFGYGLSYSSFKYDNLQLSSNQMKDTDSILCSVDIRNVGLVDGLEVAQLYIQDLAGSVARPVKELKGFKKLLIKSNETQTVSFEITPKMLEFYRKDMTYGHELGKFRLYVGTHSSKTLTAPFELI